MAKPKVKPIVSVTKSVALMNMRRKQLDHVELVRKLNAVGETQRAALLHGNVHQDAQRMQGELRAAEQQGGFRRGSGGSTRRGWRLYRKLRRAL